MRRGVAGVKRLRIWSHINRKAAPWEPIAALCNPGRIRPASSRWTVISRAARELCPDFLCAHAVKVIRHGVLPSQKSDAVVRLLRFKRDNLADGPAVPGDELGVIPGPSVDKTRQTCPDIANVDGARGRSLSGKLNSPRQAQCFRLGKLPIHWRPQRMIGRGAWHRRSPSRRPQSIAEALGPPRPSAHGKLGLQPG